MSPTSVYAPIQSLPRTILHCPQFPEIHSQHSIQYTRLLFLDLVPEILYDKVAHDTFPSYTW